MSMFRLGQSGDTEEKSVCGQWSLHEPWREVKDDFPQYQDQIYLIWDISFPVN